jgi:hypothetical protein
MPLRLLYAAIFLFWLGSVGWLCAVVWAPPESRMSQVDPREIYAVFFGWNDSTNMTLLENGERKGQVTIAGGSGEDGQSGKFFRVLSVSGSMESYDSLSSSMLVDMFWKGSIEFDEQMQMQGSEFSVRIPKKELSAQLSIEGASNQIVARVQMAGNEILKYDSAAAGVAGTPSDMLARLPMLGMLGFSGLGAGIETLNSESLHVTSEGRMGNFNFGGRDMRAFLLRLRNPDHDQEIRIYLSEVGEPLKIETDLGFEAISEILVPLEAYRHRSGKKSE